MTIDTDRLGRVLAMRDRGMTLAAIGAEIGVGKERVRQIVAKGHRIRRYTPMQAVVPNKRTDRFAWAEWVRTGYSDFRNAPKGSQP